MNFSIYHTNRLVQETPMYLSTQLRQPSFCSTCFTSSPLQLLTCNTPFFSLLFLIFYDAAFLLLLLLWLLLMWFIFLVPIAYPVWEKQRIQWDFITLFKTCHVTYCFTTRIISFFISHFLSPIAGFQENQ